MSAAPTVGFIGTGTITAAVVAGLSDNSNAPAIFLSPQSEDRSRALAERFTNVRREVSNAAVVDRSEIVVLAIRPEHLRQALKGIRFRPEQLVVSFVATVPLADIAALVEPASRICRVTPLTFIEKKRGPIVMTPAQPAVQALFEGLGDVLIAESEEQMTAFGCAASVLSTFFQIEHTVAQWLESTGVRPADASLYVRSMFSGLACSAVEASAIPLATSIETPGGLNEHMRLSLDHEGVFSLIKGLLVKLSSLSLQPKQ